MGVATEQRVSEAQAEDGVPSSPAFTMRISSWIGGDPYPLAISADSYFTAGFDPGLVWFFLSLPADGDARRAEDAFTQQIERVIKQGVTKEELARARSQALADFWRGMATIDGKAQALGTFAVLQGGHEKLFTEPRAYEAVTVEDIQKIATELLRPTNRTVGVLTSPAATGDKE